VCDDPPVLADLLRPWSSSLADTFAATPEPVPLRAAVPRPDSPVAVTIDDTARVVILAGPAAITARSDLHRLADRLGAPVANTWGAKGIYPWDDRHHMGTCGLQRDDFALLGFAEFDLVVAIGVDAAESPIERFGLTSVITVEPEAVAVTAAAAAPRALVSSANALYERIAAIAQPGYQDGAFPRHPARAVIDLKQSLGGATRVTAQPGSAGLWIARTFPTDRMGSVIVPAVRRPGIGAAVGLASAAAGTDTVCVVDHEIDDVGAEVLAIAHRNDLPLRLEVWDDDVDWSRTEDLVAAAGPVVAWT
jgi:acetolactate synthase-1/2/3 large subunit